MIEFTAGTAIGGSVGIVNRIEYIAANAQNSIINTGVKITDNNYEILADMMVLGTPTANWARYFGTYTGESYAATRFIHYQTTANKFYAGYRRQANSQTSATISLGSRKTISLSYNSLKVYSSINGGSPSNPSQTITLSAPSGSTDTSTLCVFDSRSRARMRLYEFIIKHSGTIVLDLVPVLHEGKGQMFDTVSKTLFKNTGTVDFIIPS